MKTRFPEHQLGQGTLGYKGETREYYDSKRGLWAVTRWVIVGLLLAVGAMFLWASTAPVVQASVVSVTEQPATGTNVVVVRLPDESVGTVVLSTVGTPAVGGTTAVRLLPFGRIAPEDGNGVGRSAAVVLLTAGLVMGAYSAYRLVRPKPAVTTVLAPDDAYDLAPRQGTHRSAAYDRSTRT
ncbi:MAG TPA: hypothetical protein VFL59_04080 [Candidatus Nanopelagicales bacterium]|nr:hypothetical protein [Candidatus Nanopelagicales bacterium]